MHHVGTARPTPGGRRSPLLVQPRSIRWAGRSTVSWTSPRTASSRSSSGRTTSAYPSIAGYLPGGRDHHQHRRPASLAPPASTAPSRNLARSETPARPSVTVPAPSRISSRGNSSRPDRRTGHHLQAPVPRNAGTLTASGRTPIRCPFLRTAQTECPEASGQSIQ